MIWFIVFVIGCTTSRTSILICVNQHVNLLGEYDQEEVYAEVVVSFDMISFDSMYYNRTCIHYRAGQSIRIVANRNIL
jgi:hypothetical protein